MADVKVQARKAHYMLCSLSIWFLHVGVVHSKESGLCSPATI